MRSLYSAVFLLPTFFTVIASALPHASSSHLTARDNPSKSLNKTFDSGLPTKGPVRYFERTGVCEHTPGVYDASGYIDLTPNQHIFFWFFAARSNPGTAPVTIWINGGPGASSMIGLLEELGPCFINGSTLQYNPESWSQATNLLVLDQPVGIGFSYGEEVVSTALQAANATLAAIRIWLKDPKFQQYASRDWALTTESYGGHYGPVFASYFVDQGFPLKTLTIGDGITAPIDQFQGFIDYARINPYFKMADDDTIQQAQDAMDSDGGCRDQLARCFQDKSTCSQAQDFCSAYIYSPLLGDRHYLDIRQKAPGNWPPALDPVTKNPAIMKRIGAESQWVLSNNDVANKFLISDQFGWEFDSTAELAKFIDTPGTRVILYSGDADFAGAYPGIERLIYDLRWSGQWEMNNQPWRTWYVDGQRAGYYIQAKNFSYIRFFGAGHMVPAYGYQNLPRGRAAYTMFQQAITHSPTQST